MERDMNKGRKSEMLWSTEKTEQKRNVFDLFDAAFLSEKQINIFSLSGINVSPCAIDERFWRQAA